MFFCGENASDSQIWGCNGGSELRMVFEWRKLQLKKSVCFKTDLFLVSPRIKRLWPIKRLHKQLLQWSSCVLVISLLFALKGNFLKNTNVIFNWVSHSSRKQFFFFYEINILPSKSLFTNRYTIELLYKNIKIYIKTATTCFGLITIIRERIIWAC